MPYQCILGAFRSWRQDRLANRVHWNSAVFPLLSPMLYKFVCRWILRARPHTSDCLNLLWLNSMNPWEERPARMDTWRQADKLLSIGVQRALQNVLPESFLDRQATEVGSCRAPFSSNTLHALTKWNPLISSWCTHFWVDGSLETIFCYSNSILIDAHQGLVKILLIAS